jgi:hypothetical protein
LGYQIPCFFAPQSDSEKKNNAIQKSSRAPRETTKSGVFLIHRRRRELFSATQELQSGHSLALEWKKLRTSSHSILVDTQRLKCIISKQMSSKQHVLALGLCG